MEKHYLGQLVYVWDPISFCARSGEIIDLKPDECTIQRVNENGVVTQARFIYSKVFASKRDCLVHWKIFYSNIFWEIEKQLGKADVAV